MSTFEVKVHKIFHPIVKHPNADSLDLIKIMDYVCIANRLEDGSPRYKVGDYVIYVPVGAVVPDYLLKPGFWNEEKNIGYLSGSKGNIVKEKKLRDIFSQGILFGVRKIDALGITSYAIFNDAGESMVVEDGQDVAEFLGITKYEPPVLPLLLQTYLFEIEYYQNSCN